MGPSGTGTPLFRGQYRLVSWGVCTLVSLYAFQEIGVAAALPTAVRDLNGMASFGWAFTGFLAASVVGMAGSAYLCDRHGPRLPVTAAVVLFVAGLLLAGTAQTMSVLVVSRVIQGLSGGGLMTAVYVVVGTQIPAALRPRLFAAISLCWVVPGIAGPTVSGTITESIGWRWVFLGLVPIVVLAAGPLIPSLASYGRSPAAHAPVDTVTSSAPSAARVIFAVVAAVGIAAIQTGTSTPSARSSILVIFGVPALVFGLRGLLPRGTAFASSAVGAPVALRGLTAGALFGVEAVIPLMMATQHGLGPVAAAMPLACAGLPAAISSWWVGRVGEGTVQTRTRLVRVGFGLLCVADASFILLSRPGALSWLMCPFWVLAGFGIGLVVTTANILVLERTTDADRAADASSLQVADTAMSAVTTGFAGVLVGLAGSGSLAYTTAFGVIGASMAGLAMVGLLAAGRLRRAR